MASEKVRGGVYFQWDGDTPVPVNTPPFNKQSTAALLAAAAAVPYTTEAERKQNPDRFLGMTMLEVAAIKAVESAADGNTDSFSLYLDRILGKPKQENLNTNITVGFQDYLEEIANRRGITGEVTEVTDVTAIGPALPSAASDLVSQPTVAFRKYANLDDL